MDYNLIVGIGGIVVLFTLLLMRLPIGACLALVAMGGIAFIRGPVAALSALGSMPYNVAASWSLSAIPMFIFMGALAFYGGITANLFHIARVWLNFLPGSLAIATNFACAGFAAVSGSSLATASAMGKIAVPEMIRARYDPGLATAVVAAGGTLGSLIPPSVLMIIYGWVTSQPINELLMAGLLPGLLTAFIYSLMIIIRCSANKTLAPKTKEDFDFYYAIKLLKNIWPIPILAIIIIGGIYSGIFTATEAGAIGALCVLVVTIVQGTMTLDKLKSSIVETIEVTGAIFFIAIGAILFSRFLTFSGMPAGMAGWIGGMDITPLQLILATSVVYLILGMFLDPIGLLLITVPLFLPMYKAAGVDLIWAGVLIIKYIEIGLLTPPIGMNVFVVSGVVGKSIPLVTIFKGVMWFLLAEIFIMALLISFPAITLIIPEMMR